MMKKLISLLLLMLFVDTTQADDSYDDSVDFVGLEKWLEHEMSHNEELTHENAFMFVKERLEFDSELSNGWLTDGMRAAFLEWQNIEADGDCWMGGVSSLDYIYSELGKNKSFSTNEKSESNLAALIKLSMRKFSRICAEEAFVRIRKNYTPESRLLDDLLNESFRRTYLAINNQVHPLEKAGFNLTELISHMLDTRSSQVSDKTLIGYLSIDKIKTFKQNPFQFMLGLCNQTKIQLDSLDTYDMTLRQMLDGANDRYTYSSFSEFLNNTPDDIRQQLFNLGICNQIKGSIRLQAGSK